MEQHQAVLLYCWVQVFLLHTDAHTLRSRLPHRSGVISSRDIGQPPGSTGLPRLLGAVHHVLDIANGAIQHLTGPAYLLEDDAQSSQSPEGPPTCA
jgi:hypothetical protein